MLVFSAITPHPPILIPLVGKENLEQIKATIEAMEKYGFLLVVSQKPVKCKLLRHHFLESLCKYFGKTIKFYKKSH